MSAVNILKPTERQEERNVEGLEVIKRHHFCWEGEGEPGKTFGSEGFQAMPASSHSEDCLGRI
jgi:hypothetical protein